MLIKRVLAICMVLLAIGLSGCNKKKVSGQEKELVTENLSKSFETTARVTYHDFETVMTIYKKPMNCAVVKFESPESLKDFQMTYYTDKVSVDYKEMHFDFMPDSLPGKAASNLVISALNAAMNENGISIEKEDKQLIVNGEMEEGSFSLVIDKENGNILKLSIPSSELEMEILNFKILE